MYDVRKFPPPAEVVSGVLAAARVETTESRSTVPSVNIRRTEAPPMGRRRTDELLLRLDLRGPPGSMTAHSGNGATVGTGFVLCSDPDVLEPSKDDLSSALPMNSAERGNFPCFLSLLTLAG